MTPTFTDEGWSNSIGQFAASIHIITIISFESSVLVKIRILQFGKEVAMTAIQSINVSQQSF